MLTDAAKVSIVGHDLDREGFRQVVTPLRSSSNAQLSAATTTITTFATSNTTTSIRTSIVLVHSSTFSTRLSSIYIGSIWLLLAVLPVLFCFEIEEVSGKGQKHVRNTKKAALA